MRAALRPTTEELKQELARVRKKNAFGQMLRSTSYALLAVAALAVLIATMWLPVLQVTGTSMEPTLQSGQLVVAVKHADFQEGDIIAFYHNNKILLKRVIAGAGEYVSIDGEGNVSVDGIQLEEPYLTEKSYGECDLTFPYQVPDGRLFVLGDHRATSVDSRSEIIGCVTEEMIVGKVSFCVWPLSEFGRIS